MLHKDTIILISAGHFWLLVAIDWLYHLTFASAASGVFLSTLVMLFLTDFQDRREQRPRKHSDT